MGIKKRFLKRTIRDLGNRSNLFSDESTETPNSLQRVVEKMSAKVDEETGNKELPSDVGAEGSIRAIKTKTGNWRIEFKTADGWIKSDTSSSTGFILKKRT